MAGKRLSVSLTLNDKQFQSGLRKATRAMTKFGKSMQRTGQSLSRNLTAPLVGLGAVSVKTFVDFEQSMLKVKAISGATAEEFKSLEQNAKELGRTTMFTASQVSELQLNLSKLGLTPKQINASTASILQLAQATDSDLAQAATVAASTMKGFGLEAEDMTMISDVMADSFSSTALDMDKFSTAMAVVAPVAKQAGADLQTTTAILGTIVNRGVDASTAGTALRNIFLELSNKGITLNQALEAINNSTNPLSTAMELFGKRGAAVATIIAKNRDEITGLTQDFIDSSGEASAMARIMDSGLGGSLRKMQSALEGAAIEIGATLAPMVEKLAEKINEIATKFSNLSDEQKETIIKIAALAAAIGPILLIIGKFSLAIRAVVVIFKKVGPLLSKITPLVTGLWRAFKMLTPQGRIISLVLAGVSMALPILREKFGKATEKVKDFKNMVSTTGDIMETSPLFNVDNYAKVEEKVEDLTKKFKKFKEVAKIEPGPVQATGGQTSAAPQFATDGSFFKQMEENIVIMDNMNTLSEEMTQNFESFGGAIQQAFATALSSQEPFFKVFIENAKRALTQIAAQIAAMAVLNALLGGTGIGGMMGFKNIGGFKGIPKLFGFADGGMVSGATLAMVGEGPGTSLSNPEVIAPLDKLQGMIGNAGGGAVEVFGTISGSDILLSSDRARGNRTRTRGY